MKTLTRIFTVIVAILLMASFANAQDQIEFLGLYSEGEGGAGWNANGTGAEPYGNGHGDVFYYVASRDYVDATSSAGAHMLDNISGFPTFEQALLANGFTAGQLTMKLALSDMGEDLEGMDWFAIGETGYANFYPLHCTIELDGYPLAEAIGDYLVFISGPGIREFQTGYLKINNTAAAGPVNVLNVANAFMADIGAEEMQLIMEVTNAATLSGNGRSGVYFDASGTFTKGLPEIPFMGLNADHEGIAGWDADGSGPEPEGDGHGTQNYYVASLDYDGIDPVPTACLGHFLIGSTGFLNTTLQLQYRGFEIGDLKLKLGLSSLGPDVEGEDWGSGWSNYYNNAIAIELDGEPVLAVLMDTNTMFSMGGWWMSGSSFGKVYDISANASPEAQFVAQSFLKDLGAHFLKTNVNVANYVELFGNNGRDGGIYEITEGSIVGIHADVTFIPAGTVSGTWAAEASPIYVDGHLTIEDGQTLTIEPGVKVAIRGPYHFDVQGCIKAEGSVEENIVFTRSNPNLMWDGFDYDATPATNAASVFNFCLFEYGYGQGSGVGLNSGGAIAIRQFDAVNISNSVFRYNKVDKGGSYPPSGGALALWNASPTIHHCTFYENTASLGGAILCYLGSNPEISRNLFYNNTAEQDAGAIQIYENCNPTVVNNTFSMNHAGQYGGAVDVYETSNPVFVNNIFWGNTALTDGQQISVTTDDCNISLTWCDVEGGEAGIEPFGIHNGIYANNLDEDPLFVDAVAYNFLLDGIAPSPCIDTGDPLAPRDPDGSQADMGCYYQALGKLQGFIRNAQTNLSIDNAMVTAQNTDYGAASYSTPFGSHFTLRLPGGIYNVMCEANGYQPQTVYDVLIIDGKNQSLSFYLNAVEPTFTEVESTGNIATPGIYPNPFQTSTSIGYMLQIDTHVLLKIQDITGLDIITLIDEFQEKGTYQAKLDGSMMEPGVYFCVLKTSSGIETRKLIKQ
jgi:hypothetical protein